MSYSVSVTRSGGGAVVVSRSDSGVKVVEANNVGTLVSVAQAAAGSAEDDAAAAAASALAASGSASAAASSATDAETAQTAAELAETNAETAETNAAASALAAAGSASSASTSASTATTQAGIATTQAGLAAASAVAADASADAADASAIAAAASAASITLPLPIASGGLGVALSDPGADRLMFWDDSGGTVDWLALGDGLKITTTTASVDIDGLTLKTTPAVSDELMLADASASFGLKKITADRFMKIINGLTEDTSPDSANDFIPTWDASASVAKKVKPGSLSIATTQLSGTLAAGQFPALTGDVTTVAGALATTIPAGTVTLAKMANIVTDRLIGRDTTGTGVPEALTVGGGVEFSGSGGIQRSALTGDVTASAGSNATTVISASTTQAGKVELSTDAEAITGTDTNRATTPANVAAVFADKTGTSGHKIPYLDGANTFSGTMIVSITSVGFAFEILTTEDSATSGPDFRFTRVSSTPATNDIGGRLRWRFSDSAANIEDCLVIYGQIDDPTNGSEDHALFIQAMVAGSLTTQAKISGGILLGSATGGLKGTGTLNGTAIYDDNTLLTCYVLEKARTGKVMTEFWDDQVANTVIPAVTEKIITKPAVREEVMDEKGALVLQDDGTFERLVKPAEFEIVEVEPAQEIVRTHEPAKRFAEAVEAEDLLDPAVYTARWRETGVLPLMPTPEQWRTSGPLSTGALAQRLWELCEIQAVHIGRLTDRVADLEARLP